MKLKKKKFWDNTIEKVNSLSKENNLLFKKVVFKTLKSSGGAALLKILFV